MATDPVVSSGARHKSPSAIRISNGTAIVSLTKGLEAVIDIEDLELVSGYRWRAHVSRWGHAYASRNEKGRIIFMHRVLMNAPTGMQVDHIDGDGLNNLRSNLRLATPAQNMANKVVERRNKLGLKGVSFSRTKKRYRAAITPDGKKIHLGTYATPEEAAAAYRGAAKILWGDYAYE